MSNEDVKVAVCKEALGVLSDRRSSLLPHIADSIEAQLNWLIDYFEGRNSDRSQLFHLTFGHYAAREIDPREERLVDSLNSAFYVAVQTRKGLKIDLQRLGFSS